MHAYVSVCDRNAFIFFLHSLHMYIYIYACLCIYIHIYEIHVVMLGRICGAIAFAAQDAWNPHMKTQIHGNRLSLQVSAHSRAEGAHSDVTHIYTHTHTHTHTYNYTHTHPYNLAQTHAYTHTQAHTYTYICGNLCAWMQSRKA